MCTLLCVFVFAAFGHVFHCKQLHPPEPSLVYPTFLEGRGLSGSRILKINEDITLNLKKSSTLADEFLVRSYIDGILKHTYLDGSYLEEDLFHDKDEMASVTVSNEEGMQVEGMIGNKLRIMPALEQERSSDGRVAHWLHEIPGFYEGLHNDYVMPERRDHNITKRAKKKDAKKAKIVYPELFLLVDKVFSKDFVNDEEMIKYLCRTLNAVNLRYLSVDNPKVKFKFVGIEILSNSRESFLAFAPSLPNSIDGIKSVFHMRDFLNKNKKDYDTYDIVYMVTGMGCPHDGEPAPSHFEGPGSTGCPFADGYLMSYYVHNMNQYKFSSCCKNEMSRLARSPRGKCLHIKNAKSKVNKKDKNLPGEGVPKTTQCKRAFPDLKETYCMKNKPIVNCGMQCFIPKRVYGYDTHITVPLTDGTTCNKKGHVCINGRCRKKQNKYLS